MRQGSICNSSSSFCFTASFCAVSGRGHVKWGCRPRQFRQQQVTALGSSLTSFFCRAGESKSHHPVALLSVSRIPFVCCWGADEQEPVTNGNRQAAVCGSSSRTTRIHPSIHPQCCSAENSSSFFLSFRRSLPFLDMLSYGDFLFMDCYNNPMIIAQRLAGIPRNPLVSLLIVTKISSFFSR